MRFLSSLLAMVTLLGCSSSGPRVAPASDGAITPGNDRASAGVDAAPPPPPQTDGGPAPTDAAIPPGDAMSATDAAIPVDGTAVTRLPTPIRYVVVIVKENHTFDNYFTGFPGATSTMTAKLHDGTVITRTRAPNGPLASDISHSHASAVKAYNGGAMNGFDLVEPAPNQRLPFVFYDESQIPNYWKLARNFVLCDHFFSTLAGPSSPGHFAVATAQTRHFANAHCEGDECETNSGKGCASPADFRVSTYNDQTCTTSEKYPCFDVPSIVDALPAGLTWNAYGPGTAPNVNTPFALVKSVGGNQAVREQHFRDFGQLVTDLQTGQQANYTHVDVSGGPNHISEHPPAHPCTGENFTMKLVNAVMQGPHWNESLIVITWDDYGGFYDHVKPQVEACPNGSSQPFFNRGFRLPALLISPYARKGPGGSGLVYKTVTEQASIPRLVGDLFGMPRMASRDPRARDARVGSLLEALDFSQPPRPPLDPIPQRTCP